MRKCIFLLFIFIIIVLLFALIKQYYPKIENNVIFIKEYFSNMSELDSNFIYPTEYTEISSNFGYRILYGTSNYHDGIDFLAPQGSKVYASNSGYVSYASFLNGYGNTIIISHDNNIQTLYGHLSEEFIVKSGQYVVKGQLIGYVGPKTLSNGISNGNTTGPHLHFTVIQDGNRINPNTILKKSVLSIF